MGERNEGRGARSAGHEFRKGEFNSIQEGEGEIQTSGTGRSGLVPRGGVRGNDPNWLDWGIGLKLTDEGLLVGLPCEVADVAAAAVGGGGVTDGGPVTAALGGGGLGGRLVLADGDVAIAEGVTWSVLGGVKIDGSASCWMF